MNSADLSQPRAAWPQSGRRCQQPSISSSGGNLFQTARSQSAHTRLMAGVRCNQQNSSQLGPVRPPLADSASLWRLARHLPYSLRGTLLQSAAEAGVSARVNAIMDVLMFIPPRLVNDL